MMDPREAQYDFPYTLEQAKEMALWEAESSCPRTIQHLLDLMQHHCWTNDDLNRRAVLYLLDDGLLVIDRDQRRVRPVESVR
jgi:hypothetical protein